MESATESPTQNPPEDEQAQNRTGLFSSESVLSILKLILAGSPLPEVLTIIARLVESQGAQIDADGCILHDGDLPVKPPSYSAANTISLIPARGEGEPGATRRTEGRLPIAGFPLAIYR